MKILLVDDSRVMRMIVRRTLRQAGFGSHAIVEAENGKEGLERVEDESPDVVLSDWNMPEMNGIEFLEKLREGGSRVPFVFVTSEGTPEMRATAMTAGACGFLVKPFTDSDIEETLQPLLG